MKKEKEQTLKNDPLINNNNEEADADSLFHPLIFEAEADSAISFINKLVWALLGILVFAIVIGSFKSAL